MIHEFDPELEVKSVVTEGLARKIDREFSDGVEPRAISLWELGDSPREILEKALERVGTIRHLILVSVDKSDRNLQHVDIHVSSLDPIMARGMLDLAKELATKSADIEEG